MCTSILSFVLLAVVIGLAVKVGMVNAASGSGGPSYGTMPRLLRAIILPCSRINRDALCSVQPYTCSGVSGDQGLVSTTHELATQVGLDVLKKGVRICCRRSCRPCYAAAANLRLLCGCHQPGHCSRCCRGGVFRVERGATAVYGHR